MSKEIIDKINNNLIMLVEGFDDAERDYGYDLANEKNYVSELVELVKNLSLSGVSQQRELLNFREFMIKSGYGNDEIRAITKESIDDFIKFNCG